MKQWGTVILANQGMNYLQILRYYYGSNIYIATTNNIQTPFESFQGSLTIGSSGQNVAIIQSQLARIRRNYPRIPAVSVDGQYGSQTAAAVREFQLIFGLPATGTVDRSTWYQIGYILAAVAKLAELGSEGYRPPEITGPPPLPANPPYPGTPLRRGSSGNNVSIMQRYLNTIRTAYPSIPQLSVDGIFGPGTESAVRAFQRVFGLTQDGIIGPVTWQRIVTVYNQVATGTTPPATPPPYPGTPLRRDSRGAAVVTLQENLNRVAASNPAIPRVATDGIFGPATEAAVIVFQRYYGLVPDGVVGPLTWNRLMQLEV
jgi:peptidoglycan hydrolase-like protein with peptidoglycan-binding domain